MKKQRLMGLFLMGVGLAGCKQAAKYQENHGPIVLGDSATIVTETDSQYLKDLVLDLEENKTMAAADTLIPKDTFQNEKRARELEAQLKADSLAAIKDKKEAEEKKARAQQASPKKLTAKQKREAAAKKAEEEKKKAAAKKKEAQKRKR